MARRSSPSRWITLASLMLAGESIYMLPYMRKTFATSMEQAFGVTGTELGTVNALFGVLAVVCYFPGGWLADRLPVRHLLTFSLLSTGLGGFYMLSFPGYAGLLVLHAYWGVTSILTFWAALIKATREWGSAEEQGRGFGLLDGGRGVVGALLATLATWVFSLQASAETGLTAVLWVYTLAPISAAALVWITVPGRLGEEHEAGARDTDAAETSAGGSGPDADDRPATPLADVGIADVKAALRRWEVWLLAVVVFTAYWLYVGSFSFPAFAERTLGESASFGAVVGTFRDWVRPLAAVGAGLLADRFGSSRVIGVAFALLVVTFASLWGLPASGIGLLWVQVGIVALAVFALRGVYYALMEELHIPRSLTGTTVGIVSVVGYLPDTFAFVVSGWLADNAPGGAGYRTYFGLLSAVAGVGLLATAAVIHRARSRRRGG